MKKLTLCLIFAALAGVSLFAKGASSGSAASGPTAAPGVTTRLLTDATGIDDKSFNAASWRGILEFYGDTWNSTKLRGQAYDVVTAQTQDMYVPNVRQATDEGYDLIVASGFTFVNAIREVALEYPNQNYMIIDINEVNLPNVLEVIFAEHEGSYLVGAIAAHKALADGIANPKFGFIGGVPGVVITKFEVGFVQGVLSVIPDAEIVDYYVNNWGDPASAKTQAKTWYDSGVYAIYSAAGGSGNGTIAQVKEYRLQGKNVWAIGVDSDQHDEGLYNATESAVLTSMIKFVETGMLYGLNAIKNSSFRGEVITLDLRANGVGYTTRNSALTQDIKDKVEETKRRIIAGEVQVAASHEQAKLLPGFPQNLSAKDN